MFGYLRPDEPYLFMKDDVLYKSLYCGVCKGIGKCCSEGARLSLTYDSAFLSAFIHNVSGEDVEIKKRRCVAHWFKKRPIAGVDEITKKVAAASVIMAHYKVVDDKIDGGGKRAYRFMLSKGYKRAAKLLPEIDKTVQIGYNKLREKEKRNCPVPDEAAEPFSEMLSSVSGTLLGEFADKNTDELFYHIGKWIYFIDAVDDYDSDAKKGSYNPFRAAFDAGCAAELMNESGKEIEFMIVGECGFASEALDKIKMRFNADLINNLVRRGMRKKTFEILGGITDNAKRQL